MPPPDGWGRPGGPGRPLVYGQLILELDSLTHRPFDQDGNTKTRTLGIPIFGAKTARAWQRQVPNIQHKHYKGVDWAFRTKLSKEVKPDGAIVLYIWREKRSVTAKAVS